MAWLADLAGRAEHLLNNLDESTGAAIRNHTVKRTRYDKCDITPDSFSKKRSPPPRHTSSPKKIVPVTETRSNCTPTRKPSPTHHQSRSKFKDTVDSSTIPGPRTKRSPGSKILPDKFHLNNCPKTMVDEVQGDNEMIDFCTKDKRYCLGSDLDSAESGWPIRMQNLEVENAMLKNELNVMNTEVLQLVQRLQKTEDELGKTQFKLDVTEQETKKVITDKESLTSQLDHVKTKISEISVVRKIHEEEKQRLLTHISLLQDAVKDLEERNRILQKTKEEAEIARLKVENELRHVTSVSSDLQDKLDRSIAECERLERDATAYKLRVKNMLASKDNEIKALQDGLNDTVDTRELMEQLQNLKYERDELSDGVGRVQAESEALKSYLSQIESRHTAAERVILALRDALREERSARNRVEASLAGYGKELKSIQIETGQTIASLRTALRDKEAELNNMRDSVTSVKTTDTNALNVADYEVTQDTIDKEKINQLTQTLTQKQDRMDKLLAENNILKIQLDKMESKYTAELIAHRSTTHSVVNLHSDSRRRTHSDTTLLVISNRMAAVMRRNPAFRIFIVIYMICLHFWVLTVLLNHTPEMHKSRSARS